MRLWQSLWWKLSLGVIILTLSGGFVSMLAMGPFMDASAFRQVVEPKYLYSLIAPDIRVLREKKFDQTLAVIMLESMQQRLLDAHGHDGYYGLQNSSEPHVSLAIYNKLGERRELLQDGNLQMPLNWHEGILRLERVSAAERFLIIPLDGNGTLLVRHQASFDSFKNMRSTLSDILDTYDWWLLLVCFPGIVIGVVTTRWLSHRLQRLASLTERWATGDYSNRSTDVSNDELGDHARALNRLADKLQEQVQTGYELAALQERQKLARDLHDSIKQQVFAVGLQIHAAEQWLERKPTQSKFLLNVAATLNQAVHRDLADLLNRINPAQLALDLELREFLEDRLSSWRGLIDVNYDLPSNILLPSVHAREIGYVVNEAISNAIRHGRARCVKIKFEKESGYFSLSIADNGRGFDLAQCKVGHGLINIQERIKTLPEGRVEIKTAIGKGCLLHLRWCI